MIFYFANEIHKGLKLIVYVYTQQSSYGTLQKIKRLDPVVLNTRIRMKQ